MVDITVTPANLRIGANARLAKQQQAGAAITRGKVVYKDTSDSNKWKLADANVAGLPSGANTDVGIALQDVSADQYFDVLLEDDDFTPGATLVVNTVYVLSATPGGIAPAADITTGWYGAFLMFAKSTTKAILRITKTGAAS